MKTKKGANNTKKFTFSLLVTMHGYAVQSKGRKFLYHLQQVSSCVIRWIWKKTRNTGRKSICAISHFWPANCPNKDVDKAPTEPLHSFLVEVCSKGDKLINGNHQREYTEHRGVQPLWLFSSECALWLLSENLFNWIHRPPNKSN